LAHDLFKIADMGSAHDVDYLILYGALLFHVPPVEVLSELLREEQCIVDATGWYRWI
jgi:hypothetical protein